MRHRLCRITTLWFPQQGRGRGRPQAISDGKWTWNFRLRVSMLVTWQSRQGRNSTVMTGWSHIIMISPLKLSSFLQMHVPPTLLHNTVLLKSIWGGKAIIKETSTTPSCSRPIPEQKIWTNSVPRVIFFNLMVEMEFNYFHHFSWEKIHSNDRSHAMVISIITSPLS